MKQKRAGSRFIPLVSLAFFIALSVGAISSSAINLEFRFRTLALIPIFSMLTNLFLLWTIARRRRHIKSILWFAIFVVTTIFWAFADLVTFLAANSETGMFARSFILIPALVGVASIIIFFGDTTSEVEEQPIAPRAFMLFNALFYLVIGLSTNLIFERRPEAMIQRSWGWEMQLGPFGILYLVWTQITLLYALGIVARYYRTRKRDDQKKQARIFLISVLIPIVGSTSVNILPSILGIPIIPLDSLFTTGMAILMTYGINKYRMLTINPTQIANNILQTMYESVVVVDNSFKVQYANQRAVEMIELEESLASSEQNIRDFFSPKDFERIKETIKKGLEEDNGLTDINIITKNSEKNVPVEISMTKVGSEERSTTAVGYIFVITDISDLQQAYAKLAEQEKRVERKVIERTEQLYAEHTKLETSVAGLPIGFIMLDEGMGIIESNRVAKELFEVRSKSRWYVEETLRDLGLEDKFKEMLDSKKTVDVDEILVGGKTLHLIFSPIITSKGAVLGSVIVIEDISSRKTAEIERNEFIVTASHEIRTPLTVIQGNLANVIDEQNKIDKHLLPLVKNAHRASNQISNLFNDVLIIADIESGARPKQLFVSKFSFRDLLLEVAEKYKQKADDKGLRLSLSGANSGLEIKGDRDELKEAVGKLVDNAIKFTERGFVKISLSREKGFAVLRVADSGRGIAKAEFPKLFKKFVRLDNSFKRDVGGTGLGLYIARAIAQRNGGELVLEKSSKAGSVFKLSVPAE